MLRIGQNVVQLSFNGRDLKESDIRISENGTIDLGDGLHLSISVESRGSFDAMISSESKPHYMDMGDLSLLSDEKNKRRMPDTGRTYYVGMDVQSAIYQNVQPSPDMENTVYANIPEQLQDNIYSVAQPSPDMKNSPQSMVYANVPEQLQDNIYSVAQPSPDMENSPQSTVYANVPEQPQDNTDSLSGSNSVAGNSSQRLVRPGHSNAMYHIAQPFFNMVDNSQYDEKIYSEIEEDKLAKPESSVLFFIKNAFRAFFGRFRGVDKNDRALPDIPGKRSASVNVNRPLPDIPTQRSASIPREMGASINDGQAGNPVQRSASVGNIPHERGNSVNVNRPLPDIPTQRSASIPREMGASINDGQAGNPVQRSASVGNIPHERGNSVNVNRPLPDIPTQRSASILREMGASINDGQAGNPVQRSASVENVPHERGNSTEKILLPGRFDGSELEGYIGSCCSIFENVLRSGGREELIDRGLKRFFDDIKKVAKVSDVAFKKSRKPAINKFISAIGLQKSLRKHAFAKEKQEISNILGVNHLFNVIASALENTNGEESMIEEIGSKQSLINDGSRIFDMLSSQECGFKDFDRFLNDNLEFPLIAEGNRDALKGHYFVLLQVISDYTVNLFDKALLKGAGLAGDLNNSESVRDKLKLMLNRVDSIWKELNGISVHEVQSTDFDEDRKHLTFMNNPESALHLSDDLMSDSSSDFDPLEENDLNLDEVSLYEERIFDDPSCFQYDGKEEVEYLTPIDVKEVLFSLQGRSQQLAFVDRVEERVILPKRDKIVFVSNESKTGDVVSGDQKEKGRGEVSGKLPDRERQLEHKEQCSQGFKKDIYRIGEGLVDSGVKGGVAVNNKDNPSAMGGAMASDKGSRSL